MPAESLVSGDFLNEGFEGSYPPAGWTQTGNPSVTGIHRWYQSSDSSYIHTGAASALIQWQTVRTQDEFLTSPPLDLSGASGTGLRLSFWWYTDPFWAANADFQIHLSSDNVTYTTVWKMADLGESGWAWRNTVLDVGSYAGGNLWVAFRYKGKNGADLALDDVRVGYLPAPAPPPNDDCAGAAADSAYILSQPGPFVLFGDNTFALPDYPLTMPGSCTGFSHTGKDLVWVVDLPALHDFAATMTTTGGWDDTLFLVSDCADPAGSCLDGDNALPDGSTVTYSNGTASVQRVYLVASGYAQGAGQFTVTGAITPQTAVTSSSWGHVKASYR